MSFPMDRRSPEASRLKAAVSDKLLQLVGDYTDDVFADYIVVLVCNGKNQIQARDDLEEFIGEESAAFVAWVWGQLSEEICISKSALDSMGNCERNMNNSSNPPSNEIPRAVEEPQDFQRWRPKVESPLSEVDVDGSCDVAFGVYKNRAAIEDHRCEGQKFLASAVRCSPNVSFGNEQNPRSPSQDQKIPENPLPESPRQFVTSPKTVAATDTTDVHQYMPLSMTNTGARRLNSIAVDTVQFEVSRPCGNVWDRLGKPSSEDCGAFVKKMHHLIDVTPKENLDLGGNKLHTADLKGVVAGSRTHKVSFEKQDTFVNNEPKFVGQYTSTRLNAQDSTCAMGSSNHGGILTSKRHLVADNLEKRSATLFGSKESNGSNMQTSENIPNLKKSLPLKMDISKVPNNVSFEEKNSNMLSAMVLEPGMLPKLETGLLANESFQYQKRRKVSAQKLVDTREEKNPINLDDGSTKPRSIDDEMKNVKSRLHQVESDMLQIQSKQLEMSKDKNVNASYTSGRKNHSEDDIESRTVVVTNVHFAASKAAVSSHFNKCGAIANITILTDSYTGQPKGSACIVFSSKESTSKAIQMSGTLFFSRIISVTRKSDEPPGLFGSSAQSLPPKVPLPPQPWHARPERGAAFQTHRHANNQLQWKRGEQQP